MKIVRENINDYLPAPSEEEIEKRLENIKDPIKVLVDSARNGFIKGVKKALDQGANIHVGVDEPLRFAAKNGHLEIVKYLVENGANIHAGNDLAFRWAANNGHLDVVKYLVENGADIHTKTGQALRWAANNGHLDVVKYLKSKIKEDNE